jgi:hypothetical protein
MTVFDVPVTKRMKIQLYSLCFFYLIFFFLLRSVFMRAPSEAKAVKPDNPAPGKLNRQLGTELYMLLGKK